MTKATRLYKIEGVGIIKITKRRNAVNMRLSVRGVDNIRISMPTTSTFTQAIKFAEERKGWIKEKLLENKEVKGKIDLTQTFKTSQYAVDIVREDVPKTSTVVDGTHITLKVPTGMLDSTVEMVLTNLFEQIYRFEAQQYLPRRVYELAEKHSFKFRKVTIKKLKTRWGSCSSQKNINLNLYLMQLPSQLIDYVILHELVHTVELNHGPNFWKLLETVYPDCVVTDKLLNSYRIEPIPISR